MTNGWKHFASYDYATGARLGLPTNPSPGQVVRKGAVSYVWINDGSGLNDLGFWGAFVSAIAGPILGMFGPKPNDESARQALQQQQQQIEALQQQINMQSFFDKKTIFLLALVGLGLVFAFK